MEAIMYLYFVVLLGAVAIALLPRAFRGESEKSRFWRAMK